MTNIEELDARFAVAQAVYNQIGAQVKTGGEGTLRAGEDDVVRGIYAESGGKVRDIRLNGAKVGEIRVETADRFTVSDPAAYTAWCVGAGESVTSEEMDWRRLTPAQYDEAMKYLHANHPNLFVTVTEPPTPDESWVTYRGAVCVDTETGEEIPGLVHETAITKTVVRGCKWEGVGRKGGPGWQFAPVRDAVRGLPPAEVLDLLLPGAE